MKIALTGNARRKEEWYQKYGASCNISEFERGQEIPSADLLVDLNFDDFPEAIIAYSELEMPLLLSAVKIEIAGVLYQYGITNKKNIFGINALPGFINREYAELSCCFDAEKDTFTGLAASLGMKPLWVNDRVGMVSPRIIFMIINEAYYTLQEGTASKQDIDTGMKLGTAYPFGPFEWSEMIGLTAVAEMLNALFMDTREERYKICPLLKTEVFHSGI